MYSIVRILLYTYICLVLLVLAGAVGALKLGHMRLLSVQTGSMAPTFNAGDVVLSKSEPSRHLRSGMVVSFLSQQSGAIVSHRIVSVDNAHQQLTTRGDALNKPDTPINQAAVIGRVTAVIPKAGMVLNFLKRPAGLVLFVYLPALGIVAGEVKALARHFGRGYYRLAGSR